MDDTPHKPATPGSPLGLQRPSRRSRKTSRELIAAAREVLGEDGLPGLTVRAVTARADVGHGTFYHHFESAEDVLGAAIEASMHDLAAELARQHSDASDKAWVVVDSTASLFGMLRRHPAVGWMLARPTVMVQALRRALASYVQRDIEALATTGEIAIAPVERMTPFWDWIMIGALAAAHVDPAAARRIERDLVEALLRLIGLDAARIRALQRRLATKARSRPTRRARRGARP